MNKFTKFNLDQNIIKALDKLNYKEPLEIQELVIPVILNKQNLVAKAKTGSGKTCAYATPIIEKIIWEEKLPQCLILAPTRELALQITEEISNIGTYKKINCVPIFGRQPISRQIIDLKQKCHVVVGTCGRILDHLDRNTLNLSNIKYVIIDEADEMFSMGFIKEIEHILSKCPKQSKKMLFSATFNNEIMEVINNYFEQYQYLETTDKVALIDHYYLDVDHIKLNERYNYLLKILTTFDISSCIIFCRTQENVNQLYDYLTNLEISVLKLHGKMEQDERFYNLDSFKKGEAKILIATDVAARGLDIDKVSHIINFDMPSNSQIYVHRTGRCGRLNETGVAISFASLKESLLFQELEELLTVNQLDRLELDQVTIDFDNLKNTYNSSIVKQPKNILLLNDQSTIFIKAGKKNKLRAKDIVGAICQIEGITFDDIGVIKILDNISYVTILNNKCDLVLSQLKTIKNKNYLIQKANNNN